MGRVRRDSIPRRAMSDTESFEATCDEIAQLAELIDQQEEPIQEDRPCDCDFCWLESAGL